MILPYTGMHPACPKCERQTEGLGREHDCKYTGNAGLDSDQQYLTWTCWHCGFAWRSLTADDKGPR